MELPVLTPIDANAATSRSNERCSATSEPALRLFDVPVPADLPFVAGRVRAATLGDPFHPPVVVLGGISADCFPSICPDGRAGWWPGLVGEARAIDPARHYVIGVEFAADERGGHAPSSSDQARVLAAALDAIGIDRPVTIVGASYGGMVALALAEREPERVARLVILSAAGEPHPAATAIRDLQRRIVALGIECGRDGEALSIARGLAMTTYRTAAEFEARFVGGIEGPSPLLPSDPGRYLRARGDCFGSVMSPGRFLSLSASIDRHRVDPAAITAPCLLIGATSDQLVTADQLRSLADALTGPTDLHLLDSLYGHDMFLKEAEKVGVLVAAYLGDQA
ncbi:alpha/beta fold hydrolase [Sphingomonas jaspsi]|uniref:alpha/beta fold hydrolase n=1 Tax=Sphingomonas jaspsi TaxID=392409 RepID=UPI0004BAEF2E|nr:alpha/beta fold hydrolase [Sphingomonas jaspsi]